MRSFVLLLSFSAVLLLTAYGGIDLQFGPLKPSVLLGASLPTVSPGSSAQAVLYTIEPALAIEF